MTTSPLNFDIGARMHLRSADDPRTELFDVTLIGYVQDKSLLVSQPVVDDKSHELDEQMLFNASIAAGDSVYAFQTRILHICDQPFPYMHLLFPREIQGGALRRSQRHIINEPAVVLNVQDGKTLVSVAMQDISTHGARLVAGHPLGEVGSSFVLDVQGKAAAELVAFPCVIRYLHQDKTENSGVTFHHGVEFSELDNKTLAFVAQYISDNIAQQRHAPEE